ncbi:MAG: class I SAM-dependent methyltransferase [Acidobacteriota bacterium]
MINTTMADTTAINTTLTAYYARRAAEYERIYRKPERQADLSRLKAKFSHGFTGVDLLEIASGTGYWTQFACRSARSILATDYNEEVLGIAQEKDYGECPVKFRVADAYVLNEVRGPFSGALACFWWSHVPKEKLTGFFRCLHKKLRPGAKVVMLDNRYVEGSSTPIARRDKHGNTYQLRELSDGSKHEVLKNFPTREELVDRFEPFSDNLEVTELDYYWLAEYSY